MNEKERETYKTEIDEYFQETSDFREFLSYIRNGWSEYEALEKVEALEAEGTRGPLADVYTRLLYTNPTVRDSKVDKVLKERAARQEEDRRMRYYEEFSDTYSRCRSYDFDDDEAFEKTVEMTFIPDDIRPWVLQQHLRRYSHW